MLDKLTQKYTLDKQADIHRVLLLFTVLLFLAISFALSSLLKPFILAIFFAYALNPVVDKLEKKGVNPVLAILITLIICLLVLAAIVYFLYVSIHSFMGSQRLDEYIDKFNELYSKAKSQVIALGIIAPEASGADTLKKLLDAGKSYIVKVLAGTTNFLSQAFLFTFYLILLLPGIKNFKIKVFRAFEKKKAEKVNLINDKILTQIQEYITQKTLLSLGTGVAVYLLCVGFGVDLALVWGVLTFVLNYIPNIGSLLASVFPIVVAILQPGSTTVGVAAFSTGIITVQFVIGNVIEPRVFSGKFSLSTLVVFGGLVFWGWLWGMVGVILSVPIMVIISILCQNIPSLRPIGVFLQSSFPVREDEERLSMISHMVYADDELQQEERAHIEAELSKSIYHPDSIEKVWRKVQKRPMKLEKIFRDKSPLERLELYELACRVAVLNDEVGEEEREFLTRIQAVAELAPRAVRNVHRVVQTERAVADGALVVAEDLPDGYREDQIAHSHKMLGRALLQVGELEESRKHFQAALRVFIAQEDRHEILDCFGTLSLMESLEPPPPAG